MKIYISGPITGKPDLNREAFALAVAAIHAAGHEPVNPHHINADLGEDAPWEEYLKRDIAELVTCDAILLLEGWKDSKGARLEFNLAQKLGIRLAGVGTEYIHPVRRYVAEDVAVTYLELVREGWTDAQLAAFDKCLFEMPARSDA